MKAEAWLRRLRNQLPGWHIWHSSPGRWWNAVPAPVDVRLIDIYSLPGRVTATSPQLLRDLCRERYGWSDVCDTCNTLARQCGHRRPETEGRF